MNDKKTSHTEMAENINGKAESKGRNMTLFVLVQFRIDLHLCVFKLKFRHINISILN